MLRPTFDRDVDVVVLYRHGDAPHQYATIAPADLAQALDAPATRAYHEQLAVETWWATHAGAQPLLLHPTLLEDWLHLQAVRQTWTPADGGLPELEDGVIHALQGAAEGRGDWRTVRLCAAARNGFGDDVRRQAAQCCFRICYNPGA